MKPQDIEVGASFHPSAGLTVLPQIRLWDGVALQRAGKLREAAHEYEAIVAAQPQQSTALANLGAVYQEFGELDQAIQLYEEVLQFAPTDYSALNNIGACLMPFDAERAIGYLQRALQVRPQNIEALVNLGVHKQELGGTAACACTFARLLVSITRRNSICCTAL